MAVGDFMESEVGVAVAATALVLSPRARGIARRGLVLGVAGVMRAADAVGSAAKSVGQEAQAEASEDGPGGPTTAPARRRSAAGSRAGETAS